jgi:hypothetical protein
MVTLEAARLALAPWRQRITRCGPALFRVLALTAAIPWAADAQTGASLSGRVLVESTEDPIAGVEISIAGQAVSARTDSGGRFSLRGIQPGRHVVLLRAIGFSEYSTTLHFFGGQEIETDFALVPLGQSLAKVEVKATPPSGDNPRIAEFDERRKFGLGRFVTQEELAKAEGRNLVTFLVGRIPGLRCAPMGRSCALASGRGPVKFNAAPCLVRVVYDGFPGGNLIPLTDMDPSTIAAIEYYTPATLPAQFNFEGNNPCGTLVVWSRWKAGAPNPPRPPTPER